MLNRKEISRSIKKCFTPSLFILGFAVLLNACADSRNAPRSMFAPVKKEHTEKAVVQKNKKSKASANTYKANGTDNKASQKTVVDSSISNKQPLQASALMSMPKQENSRHYYKWAGSKKALTKKNSSNHSGSKEIVNKNRNNKTGNDDSTPKNDPLAITSFVMGIAGLILFPLFSIPAIILAIISLSKIKKDPEHFKGSTFAIVGLVLGIVSLILYLLLFLLILLVFLSVM